MGCTLDPTALEVPMKLAGVLPVLICFAVLLAVIARIGRADGEVDLRDDRQIRPRRPSSAGRRR